MNITGILEAALYADDLSAAARFYGDALGLTQIAGDGKRDLFYRCGNSVLLVFNAQETLKPTSKAPTHGATGRGHVALRVEQAELDNIRKRLAEWNIPIETEVTWPRGATSIYVRDPAGNSVEFASTEMWF